LIELLIRGLRGGWEHGDEAEDPRESQGANRRGVNESLNGSSGEGGRCHVCLSRSYRATDGSGRASRQSKWRSRNDAHVRWPTRTTRYGDNGPLVDRGGCSVPVHAPPRAAERSVRNELPLSFGKRSVPIGSRNGTPVGRSRTPCTRVSRRAIR